MDASSAAAALAALISYLIAAVPGVSECSEPYLHFQQYDSSCGFAAAAAVMDCWWDVETDEEALIDNLFASHTDKNRNDRKDGKDAQEGNSENNGKNSFEGVYTITFSDMQLLFEEHGFISAGFQLDAEAAAAVQFCLERYGPFIIHEDRENGHFSVLIDMYRAASGQFTAVLADPNTGIEFYPWERLLPHWNGTALIAANSAAAGSRRVQEHRNTKKKELKARYESFRFFTERFSPSAFGY